ncbi:MAG: hypothetical protein Q4A32_01175 [Lachnospiraceae bacterium]|nr:hypothetical protein [Lachnospiraceae bacterium]
MATAKAKRMTLPQIRKVSKNLRTEDLAALLEGIYKSCPDAADYLNLRLAGESFKSAFFAETQDLLHNCFFTKKGKAKLYLPEAKDIIDRYERICPDPDSILDLKLHYVEYGMEIIEYYTNIPDSLYRGVEQMFQTIAKDISGLEDADVARSLREKFDDRLASAGKERGYGDPSFHKCMHATYLGIYWPDKRRQAENDAANPKGQRAIQALADSPAGDVGAAQSEPAAITYSGGVLSKEDSDLFFELFYPLINYANEKLHVNDLTNIERNNIPDTKGLIDIANALWKNPSVIDDYLKESGSGLSPERQAIVRGFKRAVSEKFILERNLKNGGILISMDGNDVYQVRCLTTSFEEMFFYHPLPLMLSATLLPFRGIIITDGLFNVSNIIMGGGIKKEYKNIYSLAKRRNQIITAL